MAENEAVNNTSQHRANAFVFYALVRLYVLLLYGPF